MAFFTFNLQESLRNTLNSLVILSLASSNDYYHPTLSTSNNFTFIPIKLLNSQVRLFNKMWLNHFTWIIVEKVSRRGTLLASWDVRSGPGFVLLNGSSYLCCWRCRLFTIGVRWRQSAAADISVNIAAVAAFSGSYLYSFTRWYLAHGQTRLTAVKYYINWRHYFKQTLCAIQPWALRAFKRKIVVFFEIRQNDGRNFKSNKTQVWLGWSVWSDI